MANNFESCPDCNKSEWTGIPDSLASFCNGCGFVRVGTPGHYQKGAHVLTWLSDLYPNLPRIDGDIKK